MQSKALKHKKERGSGRVSRALIRDQQSRDGVSPPGIFDHGKKSFMVVLVKRARVRGSQQPYPGNWSDSEKRDKEARPGK